MAKEFDAEGFRSAAKKEGWSEDFIQQQIDSHSAGLKGPATQPTKADVQIGGEYDWLIPALGTAATAYGLTKAANSDTAKNIFNSLKDMIGSKQPISGERIDPSFDGQQGPTVEQPEYAPRKFTPADVTDVSSRPAGTDRLQLTGPAPNVSAPTSVIQPPAPVAPTAPDAPPATSSEPVAPAPLTDKQRLEKARADLAEFKLKQAMDAATSTQKQQGKPLSDADSNLLKQSNKNTMDKANEAALKAASKPQPVPPVPTAPAAPMVETPMASPVTAAPDMAAVPPPTAEASTQATTKETKKPAKSKAIPTFKTESDIPKGMVFRPDVGNLDRSLVNILGTEGRLHAKDVLNEGQMFGNYKGTDYNKKVSDLVGAYGEELKKITPSIDLTTRDGRVAAGLPHTQNYGPALGKAVKVGGVLGTLMTVAQSANAKEALGNVAESLLPIGMTPSELQSGKLTAKQLKAFEEAQKLGSPYRSVPPPTR